MTATICSRCNGTGYANAARDSGKEHVPLMIRPIGVYLCTNCNGSGKTGFTEEEFAAMLSHMKALSPATET